MTWVCLLCCAFSNSFMGEGCVGVLKFAHLRFVGGVPVQNEKNASHFSDHFDTVLLFHLYPACASDEMSYPAAAQWSAVTWSPAVTQNPHEAPSSCHPVTHQQPSGLSATGYTHLLHSICGIQLLINTTWVKSSYKRNISSGVTQRKRAATRNKKLQALGPMAGKSWFLSSFDFHAWDQD